MAARGIVIVGNRATASAMLRSAGAEWVDCVEPDRLSPPRPGRRPSLFLVGNEAASRDDGRIFATLRNLAGCRFVPRILLATPTTGSELLESSAGHGMDDCVPAPLTAEAIGTRLATLYPARPPPAPSARLAPKRIVVAGEDREYRRLLTGLFQHCGLHVLDVGDVPDPARLHAAEPVHVVLIATDLGRVENDRMLRVVLGETRGPNGMTPPTLVVAPLGSRPQAAAGHPIQVIDRSAAPEAIAARVGEILGRSVHFLRPESRVPFFCAVEFREAGASGAWSSGYSWAISPGGVFVRTLVPHRAGAPIELKIRVPTTGEELLVTGVTAWANPFAEQGTLEYPAGMGVQFLGVISKSMAQLIEICRSVAAE